MSGIDDLIFAVDQYVGAMKWHDAEEVEYTEITTEYEDNKEMALRIQGKVQE